MGTVSIDERLPFWAPYIGIAMILLMAVALLICILRDVAEMRLLWAMEAQTVSRMRYQKAAEKDVRRRREKPPRRQHHGVCLLETDLRYREPERRRA